MVVGEAGSAWEAAGLHHRLLFGSEPSSVAAAGCKRRGFQTWVPNVNQVLPGTHQASELGDQLEQADNTNNCT